MRVLIAEDDQELGGAILRCLRSVGHEVTHLTDGRHADREILRDYDVVILDRMLPSKDGLAILADARAAGVETPVLMLTALGQIADRVEGLSVGADDYLVKPFAFDELLARIVALARRRSSIGASGRLSIGRLVIDLLHRDVRFRDRPIALQPREIRLLEMLVRNAGTVVTRAMLLEMVWGFHFDPQTNLVETHMSRLRSKLTLGGLADAVETVRGAGYRFRAESAE